MMDLHPTFTDLPVLILHNLEPEWPREDIESALQVVKILSDALRKEGYPVSDVCLENRELADLLHCYDPNDYIVLNWCEAIPGIPHSFDLIARILEDAGFVFTGADSQALSLSQDKRKVKQRLDASGTSTPRWQVFSCSHRPAWNIYPAIIKPALEHCSFGVSRESVARTPEELSRRIDYIFETFQQPALVEEFIDGREFHVTVIGNGTLHVLPPAEMDFSAFEDARDRLCTYDSKFDPDSAHYRMIKLNLPAFLTEEEGEAISSIALQAYRVTGCRDYARLDIRLRDGIFYILDVNPNADISPDTSLALAAEQVGLPYGKLASYLVNLAAQRHPIFGKQ